MLITATTLVLMARLVLAGDVYTCSGPHGEKVYSDVPCPKAAKQRGRVHVQAKAPPVILEPAPVYGPQASPVQSPPTPSRVSRYRSNASPAAPTGMHGGLGTSRYGRGGIHGTRCTTAAGSVYYADALCGSSEVQVGEREKITYEASDPRTGRTLSDDEQNPGPVFDPIQGRLRREDELEWTPKTERVPVYEDVPDRSKSIPTDAACTGAQNYAEQHPHSDAARRRVDTLCHQGRSLYELKPSRNSLYNLPAGGGASPRNHDW